MPRKMVEQPPAPKDPAVIEKEHSETFKTITNDELKQMQDQFGAAMFDDNYGKDKKADKPKEEPTEAKEGEKPKEEKPKTEAKKDDKPKEEKPKEDKPKEEPKPPGALITDDEPIVLDGDDQLPGDESQPQPKVRPEEKPSDDDLSLSEDDKEQLAAVEWLAANDKRFQGRDLGKELKAWWKKEEVYAQRWKKENPGEEFNPGASEHADFYASNQSPVLESDIKKGNRGVITDEAARIGEERAVQRLTPEIQSIRFKERMREERPKIDQARRTAIGELAAQAVPEFAELIGGKEGDRVITKEVYDKLAAENPVAIELLDDESHVLKAQIVELETLRHLGDVVSPDRNKAVKTPLGVIRPVEDILNAGLELEQRIMAQPANEQLWDGRRFVPRAALHTRIEAIMNGGDQLADKQAKIRKLHSQFWTIDVNDIRDVLIKQSAKRVARSLARFPKQEKVSGKKPETDTQKNGEEKPAKAKVPPAPSTSSSSDNVDTDSAKKSNIKKQEEEIAKGMGWE